MNLDSQSLFYPPQPDNSSDNDRYFLSQYALKERGWPEDFSFVARLLSPPPQITNYAKPGEFKNVKVAIIGGGSFLDTTRLSDLPEEEFLIEVKRELCRAECRQPTT